MSFADLDEFFDDTLKLPIGGKVYVISSVDAETGLWCQRMLSTAADVATGTDLTETDVGDLLLEDDQERDLYRRVLGAVYDELLADGVSWERVKHAGTTAFMWAAGNKQTAEEFWATGGDEGVGEPARPTPQDHKAPAKQQRKGPRASPAGSTKPPAAAAPAGGPS